MSSKKKIEKDQFEETPAPLNGRQELPDQGKTDKSFGHVKEFSKKVIDKGSKRMHS